MTEALENHPKLWRARLPTLQADGNKYTRGHALIYGGYPMTGAARLSARAAARIGAGLVTIAVPEIAFPIYATALTSIMVRPLSTPKDFDEILNDKRFSALLIGPGAGVNDITKARTLAMLATGRPTVLDADAISVFEHARTQLDKAIIGPCVLTPHTGEFSRIFDNTGDRLSDARNAAKRSNAILVLKGHETIIAAPDGRTIINRNAPPTLATEGSGDVLSGIMLGLLAQGMEPFYASAAAVWLHGAAATAFGPGLIADDLPDALPKALRELK